MISSHEGRREHVPCLGGAGGWGVLEDNHPRPPERDDNADTSSAAMSGARRSPARSEAGEIDGTRPAITICTFSAPHAAVILAAMRCVSGTASEPSGC